MINTSKNKPKTAHRQDRANTPNSLILPNDPTPHTLHWVTDADGIIRARDQHFHAHPSKFVAYAVEVGRDGRGFRREATSKHAAPEQNLVRLTRGAYMPIEQWDAMQKSDQFRTLVKAYVPRGSCAVITGEAAAALLGFPVLTRSVRLTVANSGKRAGGKAGASMVCRVSGPIDDMDIITIDGRLGTDSSESPGESLTKAAIILAGIAQLHDALTPLLQQVEFRDDQEFIGRVDFFLPHLHLAIEFDGLTKYSKGNVRATEQSLIDEGVREKRLKNLGITVIRLTGEDVLDAACVEQLRDLGEQLRRRIETLQASGASDVLCHGRYQAVRSRWSMTNEALDRIATRRRLWIEHGRGEFLGGE